MSLTHKIKRIILLKREPIHSYVTNIFSLCEAPYADIIYGEPTVKWRNRPVKTLITTYIPGAIIITPTSITYDVFQKKLSLEESIEDTLISEYPHYLHDYKHNFRLQETLLGLIEKKEYLHLLILTARAEAIASYVRNLYYKERGIPAIGFDFLNKYSTLTDYIYDLLDVGTPSESITSFAGSYIAEHYYKIENLRELKKIVHTPLMNLTKKEKEISKGLKDKEDIFRELERSL